MASPLPRYDVVVVANGIPQPRQSFNAVDAAAEVIARNHAAGHIVKVLTNAITEKVKNQRLQGLADRVNEVLGQSFAGQPWQP